MMEREEDVNFNLVERGSGLPKKFKMPIDGNTMSEPQPTRVGQSITPQVGGDNIQTGNIQNAQGVAIGARARAEINHYTEIIVKLDTLEDVAAVPGDAPYKGLAYFTEDDDDIYYGREALSDHLMGRLRESSFLAVVGASGSGKSSLLRAGVVPRLRSEKWLVHVITPGRRPLNAFADTLTRDIDNLDFADKVRQSLAKNAQTVQRVAGKLTARANAPRLLLVVDQFEEVFTQCDDPAERRAFVHNLLAAAEAGGAASILIGMRADFYGRCAEFEGLRELVSQQQEFIGPMKQEDLVRVIAEPAKKGGWQFAEGLVEQILEDAGDEPGRLPLLSHALRETWERRRGVTMTLAGYRAAGGVEGAIAKTAEDTLQRLEQTDKSLAAVAQSVFLALTELGEGAEDTRRIASLDDLAEKNAERPLDEVLKVLVNGRLITTGDGQVEVAHEALIRRWPRLREWVTDNRERIRFERQLSQDAEEWEELDKDVGALYRGARLQQAIELVDKGEIEVGEGDGRFLAASREEADREAHEKEARRQRELTHQRVLAMEQQNRAEEAESATKQQKKLTRIALTVGAISLMLAFVTGIFWKNSQNARQAEAEVREELDENAKELQANLLAQQAIAEESENPQLSLLLAIESYKLVQRSDAHGIIRAVIETQNQSVKSNPSNVNMQSPYAQPKGTVWPVWKNSFNGESESHYCTYEPKSKSEWMCLWSADKSKYLVFESLGDAYEFDAFIVDAESGEELLRFPEIIDPIDGGWQEEDTIIWLNETTSPIQRALDARSGKQLFQFAWNRVENDEDNTRFFEFNNELSQLITWQSSGAVKLYVDGNFQNPIWSRDGTIQWANFFIDGSRFITLDENGLATAWNTSDQNPLLSFDNVLPWSGFNNISPPIEWKSDGSEIALMKEDGQVYIYPTEAGKWIDDACAIIDRNMTWEEWKVNFPNETYYHPTCANAGFSIHPSVPDGVLHEINVDNLAEYFEAWELVDAETAATVRQAISEERNNFLMSIVDDEQITTAVSFYNYAAILPTMNPFSANNLAELCLVGSLLLQAEEVMFACEEAIDLDPEYIPYQGVRGVALLMMGRDLQTAKDDLQNYLNWREIELDLLVLQRDIRCIVIRRATLAMRKISSMMASLIIIDNRNGSMSIQLRLLQSGL